MRIAFISPDINSIDGPDGNATPGGSNYARCWIPGKALEAAGHYVVQGMAIQLNSDLRLDVFDGPTNDRTVHENMDVIVLHRWMDKMASAFVRTARRSGQVIINDVDDWWWGMSQSNSSFNLFNPRHNPDTNLVHYSRNLGVSSAITCSTPFLAEKMAQRAARVPTFLIRNRIDAERYPRCDVSGPTMVGWVGHSGARSGDLETMHGILLPWCKKTGAGFFHGGADKPEHSARNILGFPEDWPGRSMPMQLIDNYPKLFRRGKINIGIVPLSSMPFNTAKSYIKGLEYAACGIPFIAQATPEYVHLCQEYGIGFVAKRPKEWLKLLDRLNDPSERVSWGAIFRDRVQQFTPTASDLAGEWERVIEKVQR